MNLPARARSAHNFAGVVGGPSRPKMLRFSPTTGDYTRETILTFTGHIPSGGQQLKCKVGDHLEVAIGDDGREGGVQAGRFDRRRRARWRCACADGIRFYDAASRFTYYDADAPPTISSLAPRLGTSRGSLGAHRPRVQPRADRAVALPSARSSPPPASWTAAASRARRRRRPPASAACRSASRMTAAAAGAWRTIGSSPTTPQRCRSRRSSAAPSAADAAAATTTVEVAGANFAPLGDALRCRFGAAAATAATFVDGGRVRCEAHAPSAAAGSVDLRLSRDGGRSWSDGALPFTFYDARQCSR